LIISVVYHACESPSEFLSSFVESTNAVIYIQRYVTVGGSLRCSILTLRVGAVAALAMGLRGSSPLPPDFYIK